MSSGSNTVDSQLAPQAMESFIADYYEHLAQEDAQAYDPQTLEGRAQEHLNLARDRTPGSVKVEIINEPEQAVVYIVTDDMPFLVDSVTAELVRQNTAIRMMMHPMFVVTRHRDSDTAAAASRGSRTLWAFPAATRPRCPTSPDLVEQGDNTSCIESWIAVEIPRLTDAVREVPDRRPDQDPGRRPCPPCEDWSGHAGQGPSDAPRGWPGSPGVSPSRTCAGRDLLHWMDDGNFTFLGYREYDLINEDGEDVLRSTAKAAAWGCCATAIGRPARSST